MARSDEVYGDLKKVLVDQANRDIRGGATGIQLEGAKGIFELFHMMDTDPCPPGKTEAEYVQAMKDELPAVLYHCRKVFLETYGKGE